jgi:hypothetical protein
MLAVWLRRLFFLELLLLRFILLTRFNKTCGAILAVWLRRLLFFLVLFIELLVLFLIDMLLLLLLLLFMRLLEFLFGIEDKFKFMRLLVFCCIWVRVDWIFSSLFRMSSNLFVVFGVWTRRVLFLHDECCFYTTCPNSSLGLLRRKALLFFFYENNAYTLSIYNIIE